MDRLVFPLYTLPALDYMQLLLQTKEAYVSLSEPFIKQTFRSRYEIATAHHRAVLSIPMAKGKTKTSMATAKISYAENWQRQHWNSIENAYRNSPFFQYYEDDIKAVFMQKPAFLWEYNISLLQKILQCLKCKTKIEMVQELPNVFEAIGAQTVPEYDQVFIEKLGFMPNLSILDWLFNNGPLD